MLVLTRRVGESILIGDDIVVTVLELNRLLADSDEPLQIGHAADEGVREPDGVGRRSHPTAGRAGAVGDGAGGAGKCR